MHVHVFGRIIGGKRMKGQNYNNETVVLGTLYIVTGNMYVYLIQIFFVCFRSLSKKAINFPQGNVRFKPFNYTRKSTGLFTQNFTRSVRVWYSRHPCLEELSIRSLKRYKFNINIQTLNRRRRNTTRKTAKTCA